MFLDRVVFVDVPTFVVDMHVVRCESATVIPDAFAGLHYLSMFGEVGYMSSLPESMQRLISRWLSRHGFPNCKEVLCGCVERKIIELAYFSVQRVVLFEHVRSYTGVLAVLDRLRHESSSLYDSLCGRMRLIVYGGGYDTLETAPVPVMTLPSWRQVHSVIASLDLAINSSGFAHLEVPRIAEKAAS